MLEMGTAWVPTYTSVVGFLLPHDDYNSSASFQRGSHLLHYLQKGFRRALELGVTILTATDTQYGPSTNVRVYREMTHFVEMGMTPAAGHSSPRPSAPPRCTASVTAPAPSRSA